MDVLFNIRCRFVFVLSCGSFRSFVTLALYAGLIVSFRVVTVVTFKREDLPQFSYKLMYSGNKLIKLLLV